MNKIALFTASMALLSTGPIAQAGYVDLFEDPVFPAEQLVEDNVNGGLGNWNEFTTANPTILGGSRDLIANAISGAGGSLETQLVVTQGSLNFSNSTSPTGGVVGVGVVQWDGLDMSPLLSYGLNADLIDQIGCPPAGCSQFDFEVAFSDASFEFSFGVYTDALNYSVLTTTSLGVPGPAQTFEFPFAAFLLPTGDYGTFSIENVGAGPDFASVGALELILNSDFATGGTAAIDLTLNSATKSGVPEPSVLALMGFGIVAGGVATRRRRQKKA